MNTAIGKSYAIRRAARVRGLTLIELMISMAIGLVIIAALLALFVNVTLSNNEMTKMNRQIENGRFAIQLLQDDVVHAGYWGSYVPQFDDLTAVTVPLDAPAALPAICLGYSGWTDAYRANLIGIPVQGYVGVPWACTVVASKQANTDVLVARHAETCVAGVGNCEDEIAGNVYFQSTLCENEISNTAQQPNSALTIKLNATASDTDDIYNGATIRIIAGTGAGQSRKITDYNGSTKEATVASSWLTIPDNSSIYAFGSGYVLGTAGHFYHAKDCATTASKRKFISNIYYIRNYASTPGDGIPTLMRSSFGLAAGVLRHQSAQPLIEGIQGFRVEYGIDAKSETNANVNYAQSVVWANPLSKVTPTNRGDGIPESYVNAAGLTCNSVSDCNAANVVAVRIHVLARSLEPTKGYVDSKTYRLGDQILGPFNDNFKRHVFSTTVRLANPAGRRETP